MLYAYRQSWLHTFQWNRRMDWDTYWQAMLIHILVAWIPITPLILLQDDLENWMWNLLLLPLYYSVFPMVGSTVQRLRDVGKSAITLKTEGNTFVDEKVTEQSLRQERQQLLKVLAIITGTLLLDIGRIFINFLWYYLI